MATLLNVFLNAKRRDRLQINRNTDSKTTSYAQTEYWTVIYDGVVTPLEAAAATGLPVIGASYGGLICTSVVPTRTAESPFVWEVQVDYASRAPNATSTNWNISLSVDDATTEQTAFEDRLGLPLCNVNNDVLDNLPNETVYHTELTISYQSASVPNWSNIKAAKGKVNSDAVDVTICGLRLNYAKRQMKFVASPIRCNKTVTATGTTITYDVTFKFLCKEDSDTYIWRAPNLGYRAYNDADELDDVKDTKTGTPRTKPARLGVDGKELAPTADMVWLPDGLDDTFPPEGRFELEEQTAFGGFFSGLAD